MAATVDPPSGLPHVPKWWRSSINEPPMLSMETELRIIVFGSSDQQQFSLTESILQKEIFKGIHPKTILTTKSSGSIFNKNVTVVNTPNLMDHDLSHYLLKKELKKAVCFSCPGPHAILFTLNPLDLPANAYNMFKPVVQCFGEGILNNTMVVLYHEEEQWRQSLEDSVKKNKPFREILEKCGQRYLVFGGRENRSEDIVMRELFEKIDNMVAEHGIFSNLEFKDADKRIKAEEKMIENKRKKEVSAMLEELKKKYSNEDLEREVNLYEEKTRLENRNRAEEQIADRLGFALRLVDYAAAIGKGAFAGALVSVAMGFPGMAVGAVIGAALGGLLGGAAVAAWNIFTNALPEFGRET